MCGLSEIERQDFHNKNDNPSIIGNIFKLPLKRAWFNYKGAFKETVLAFNRNKNNNDINNK